MSDEERKSVDQMKQDYLFEDLDYFYSHIMMIPETFTEPGYPADQMRYLISCLSFLDEDLDGIFEATNLPEELVKIFLDVWRHFYEYSELIHVLNECLEMDENAIYHAREATANVLNHMSVLLAAITGFLNFPEESRYRLFQYNWALEETLRLMLLFDIPVPEDDDTEDYSHPFDILAEKNFASYPYKKIQNTSNEEEYKENCAICLCDLEDDVEVRRLPCHHVFHKDCVDEWLRGKWRCPVCRFDIREETEDVPHIEECWDIE